MGEYTLIITEKPDAAARIASALDAEGKAKRVVDCDVETQALIEDESPFNVCGTGLTEASLFHQWIHGVLFGHTEGKPIVTKVKNFQKNTYTGPPADYTGDVYSADVEIRFCTNCGP